MLPIYKKVDYTGKEINNWTILERVPKTQKWGVKCSCGSVCVIDMYNILLNKSTGCRVCVGKRHSKTNNPNWKGTKDIPASLYTSLKYGAKSRKIPFKISIDDLQNSWDSSDKLCYITKVKLEIGKNASVDRVDSSKEYFIDNIKWVQKDINIMKNDLDLRKFIQLCKEVSKANI